MQGYNCIMVYSHDGEKLLLCKRTKDPYKGLYNLVGGKIEKGENGYEAAYRELNEETGIDSNKICLSHMMDFTYYNQNCFVEVYVGQLIEEVVLREETHPLHWLSTNEDFFDDKRFAGEGNIGHMVEQVRIYGMGVKYVEINTYTDLLSNIDKIHTTKLGAERIRNNLSLSMDDVISWCKEKIQNNNNVIRKGKNWYVYVDDFVLTINANSFTIITAHKVRKKQEYKSL